MSPKPILIPTMLDGVKRFFFVFLLDLFISNGQNAGSQLGSLKAPTGSLHLLSSRFHTSHV
jgi:hypothetical protein